MSYTDPVMITDAKNKFLKEVNGENDFLSASFIYKVDVDNLYEFLNMYKYGVNCSEVKKI